MNISSDQEGDDHHHNQIPISNPIPITSKYTVVVHGNHHHHHHRPQNQIIPSSSSGYGKKLVVVKYIECLKNHAASMGGSVIDGCCEFMSGGKEGTIEALKCSACNCHRNFHRKCILEEEDEEEDVDHHIESSSQYQQHTHLVNKMRKTSLLTPHQVLGSLDQSLYPTPAVPIMKQQPCTPSSDQQLSSHSSKMMMLSHSSLFHSNSGGSSLPAASSDSDEIKTVSQPPPPPPPSLAAPGQVVAVKKRFRSKFTQEQKDKMLSFAEKVGWSFQKEEEANVLQICQEIGIKKRVLRVWMHNNKHNFATKKIISNSNSNSITTN
ncbi:zinc-finger homeodomain protein 6-like [Papaver somniferum]|uniref:zinc-finger homeodomain protein 6-like n=1 Tax=Papaver somniferum TaxID=3469 RepID=UPI000E6FA7B2|nr:zinc-finger homeodomain protein 6-like [Papaver somniferum]